MSPLLIDLLLSLFSFLTTLHLTGHLHDLYPCQRTGKPLIERKCVFRIDIASFGGFRQYSKLATSEGLKGSYQVGISQIGR